MGVSRSGVSQAETRASARTSRSFAAPETGCEPWPPSPSATSVSQSARFSVVAMPFATMPPSASSGAEAPPSFHTSAGGPSAAQWRSISQLDAGGAGHLLVRARAEDEVAPARPVARGHERQRRREHRAVSLVVERAASPHGAVPDHAAEGRRLPLRGVGRHDVEVREQQDRARAVGRGRGQPRDHAAAAGRRLEPLGRDAARPR